jgi:hypothetical protein
MMSAAWPTSCQESSENATWWNLAGSARRMKATSCGLFEQLKNVAAIPSGVSAASVSEIENLGKELHDLIDVWSV